MEKKFTIELRPINRHNWEACAKLKVGKDQEDNLPGNLFSIAELNFYPQTKAVVIFNHENTPVGFATFGFPEGGGVPKIFRLMIDKEFQGRGYGKAALIKIVEKLFSESDSSEIQVCYNPSKKLLKDFYGSIGFEEKEILPCKRSDVGKMLAILNRDAFLKK